MSKVYELIISDEVVSVGSLHEITKMSGIPYLTLQQYKTPRFTTLYPDYHIKLNEIGYYRFKKEYLRELVELSGENIAELGRDLNLSKTGFGSLLSGITNSPSKKTINKICDYFGIPEHELFEFIKKEKK